MYTLTEAQIDLIHRDIQNSGIELESLQQDLLDHVCCIIEQNLQPGADFETFYRQTIRTFYRNELKEIEEETLYLLANKNYYAMKKIMLFSGGFSALVLSLGILFKFAHWPGAGILIMLGILLFSLLFLPLLFTLKIKEREQPQNKFVLAIGTLSAILFCLSTLFKLMHWPMANVLGISAIGIMLLLFLPVYFFTGIRNPETKINSIVTSILIVGASGLLMSLVRSPGNSTAINKLDTANFLRNEQLLSKQWQQLENPPANRAASAGISPQASEINRYCQQLKAYLLEKHTGYRTLPQDYETNQILLTDGWARDHFQEGSEGAQMLVTLRKAVERYNKIHAQKTGFIPVSVTNTVLDQSEQRTLAMLNGLTQIQWQILQNEPSL